MSHVAIVVAYDEHRVIGTEKNDIPWNLPEDMRWFKEVTEHNVVAMGRKTFESIGRVLPNRTNIVISKTLKSVDGAVVVDNILDAALFAAIRGEDLYILGGERIYKEALVLVDKLYITHVNGTHGGDKYFPELDLKNDWFRISRKKHDTHMSCIYMKRPEGEHPTLTLK
jgi:dihydrofolate reductase